MGSHRVLLLGDATELGNRLTYGGIHSAITSAQAAATAVLSANHDKNRSVRSPDRPLQGLLAVSQRVARAIAQPT